ncbi:MAG TPA: hypothetical protein VFX38_07485 [Gammaproteobacteria bacterium]|nr:hypothetical protein [Gammaproteobacteria bacterium]
MRKLILTAFLLTLGFAAAGVRAGAVSPADQKFFDDNIGKVVKPDPTPLANPALAKMFTGRFYNVELNIAGAGEKIVVAREGNDLIAVTTPSTTADMPGFPKLLKPDFRLKSDEDAHVLQDALDVLYPIDDSFGGEDAQAKTIRHAGNVWTFVRGKFFEHFKGFVFTTDESGAVTKVQYSLDIK